MRYDLGKVKAAAEISRIVAGYITLRRVSRTRLSGLCPFQKEKTPSFTVQVDRQRYHCYGCAADGDVLDFVGHVEGLQTFGERIRRVAELVGIAPEDDDRSEAERQRWHRARASALDLATSITDWSHGLNLVADTRKAQLVALRHWAWESGAERVAAFTEERLEEMPRYSLAPSSANPRFLADAYVRSTRSNIAATNSLRDHGRRDRENAELVTGVIVDLLAIAQDRDGRVAA